VQSVVLKYQHGHFEYRVTNALAPDLTTLVERERSRWRIDTALPPWWTSPRSGGI